MEASGILGLTRLKRYRCWQCTLLGTAWREFAFFSRCGAGQTHIDDNYLSLCVRSPLQTISQKVVWANILSGEENSQNTFGILCLPLQNLKSYFRMRREDLGGATRYKTSVQKSCIPFVAVDIVNCNAVLEFQTGNVQNFRLQSSSVWRGGASPYILRAEQVGGFAFQVGAGFALWLCRNLLFIHSTV